ncbi:MAG: hypothetical protein OP8BY_2043 [Candidatus Saccharicenans subterraneus]|uniref:Uncharacterized protein n=1 Tax=Candidatus Saccharicenans subterraneus TaxID=2508984 RepID=A0A3E2BN24_9BACT|nr:MAG: hypothetical protein OP8BY_2043 [Candidatus Saccharicenans subterraneum]
MEWDPAPWMMRNPGPAILGPDPAPIGIGSPVTANSPRDPDITVGIIINPVAIVTEIVEDVGDGNFAVNWSSGSGWRLVGPDPPVSGLIIGYVHDAARSQENQRKDEAKLFHLVLPLIK